MKVVHLLFACLLSSSSETFAFKFLNNDAIKSSLASTTGQRLSKVRQVKNGKTTEHRQETSFTDDTIKQMIESYTENTGSQTTPTPAYLSTSKPTSYPTKITTVMPTSKPTIYPTKIPSAMPTPKPTGNPTKTPTAMPTPKPTGNPTKIPTAMPTPKPTGNPTKTPTAMDTARPSGNPANTPTRNPTTKPVTNGPSSKPTGNNATLYTEGHVSEESIDSNYNALQASQVQEHNSTQTADTIKRQPNLDTKNISLPTLISTIAFGLLCVVAVGVTIMAWVMGGPEEDDWSRSDRATLPSVYSEREKVSPQMDKRSHPSQCNTLRENSDHYPNDKKKSIWRKTKDKSSETRSSNMYPKEETAVAAHGSWWERLFDNSRVDRFLDNTINKVC